MYRPKCLRSGVACKQHEAGKYLKWSCNDIGYSKEERRKLFEKKKIKCPHCKKKMANTSTQCQNCHFKTWVSPLLGIKLPEWWRKKISDGQKRGEDHHKWKGESAGYWAKHRWVIKRYGNPINCSNCNTEGKKNAGGRWTIQWANISGKYYRKIEDYKGLCTMCHCIFDGKTRNAESYEHGDIARYRKGCRCKPCREAKRINRKLYE